MKIYVFFVIASAALFEAPKSFGHGRSEQMNQVLNAKTPNWLSLGIPIKVEPTGSVPMDETAFRPRSGGATNSRNRVQIPARGIEIQVDYEINYTGNNEAGTGSSLSPDGTRLIVNAGHSNHLYEISATGEYLEVPIQLPSVTYDAGPKGFITGWSWIDNQTVFGHAEIDDDTGNETIECRIYVYHMKERVLSRLDLSALNLTTTDGLEITKVGRDSNHLEILVGNTKLTVKADLKSSPKIEKLETHVPKRTPARAVPNKSELKISEAKLAKTGEKPALVSRLLWIMMIFPVLGLLWFVFKKAKLPRL